MEQKTYNYKDYSKRIVKELKQKDPKKYAGLTEKAVANHILHINYGFSQIVLSGMNNLKTAYFNLDRAFHKFTNMIGFSLRYQRDRTRELNNRVIDDNVINRLRIDIIPGCDNRIDYESKVSW